MNLRALDDAVIDDVQVASDWVHSCTGLDCLVQARCFSAISAVLWLLITVSRILAEPKFPWISGMCLLFQVRTAFYGDNLAETGRTSARTGTRNPKRLHPWLSVIRTSLLVFTVAFVLTDVILIFAGHAPSLANDLLLLCILAQEILTACDVQTPRDGKIREALQSWGFAKRRLTPTA